MRNPNLKMRILFLVRRRCTRVAPTECCTWGPVGLSLSCHWNALPMLCKGNSTLE